jgi:low affinity Fe/Cu permease
MEPIKQRPLSPLERFSIIATRWVGSTQSLVVHTGLFIFSGTLVLLGAQLDKVLLVLTTIVSLEAIYLSIFIQMSVNRQGRRLHAVSKDIEEIQEDVEGIEKDVDEIQKDVDEIQEDVEEIGEDDDDTTETHHKEIEKTLALLIEEIAKLKKTSGKSVVKK